MRKMAGQIGRRFFIGKYTHVVQGGHTVGACVPLYAVGIRKEEKGIDRSGKRVYSVPEKNY